MAINKTKILLDPQIFIDQQFGGISRYFTELYSKFEAEEGLEVTLPLLYTDNIHFKESGVYANSFQYKNSLLIKCSPVFRAYIPRKLKRKSKEITLELLKSQEFDLFIPTYYDPYFLDYLGNKPFVLTVHDMIHELYPQYFTDDIFTSKNKMTLIKKATRIIAISENTKKDIIKIYPDIPASKIDVVYLARDTKETEIAAITVPENYILFVGNRTIYKNFIFFLKSLAPILKKKPELFILCAGGNTFNQEELALINELQLSDQVIQQNFTDAQLPGYYKKALCFVFPSEYEGFGLPVLESMACGCPAILTNHSSFPEIAGEAAMYFKLNDESDLRNKVNTLLDSDSLREQYKLKGLEQVRKFSWEKTKNETLKVYRHALTGAITQ